MYMTNNTEEWLDLLKAFVEPMTETWKDGFIKGYEHATEEFEEDCPADIHDPSDDIEKAYQSGYRMGGQYAWGVARILFSMSDDAIERVFLYKNKEELFDKLKSFASVDTIYTAYIRGEDNEND